MMESDHSRNTNFLLWELIDDVRQGLFSRCRSAGLSTDDIRLLTQLQLDDICYISSSAVSIFRYRVDPDLLRVLITRAREARARKTQAERALSLGASARMMNFFFGWTARDVARYRELAPDSVFTRGRPPIPSETVARDILQRLRASSMTQEATDHEVLEILMDVAQQTTVPLCSVWQVIDETLEIIRNGYARFARQEICWQRLSAFDFREREGQNTPPQGTSFPPPDSPSGQGAEK